MNKSTTKPDSELKEFEGVSTSHPTKVQSVILMTLFRFLMNIVVKVKKIMPLRNEQKGGKPQLRSELLGKVKKWFINLLGPCFDLSSQ